MNNRSDERDVAAATAQAPNSRDLPSPDLHKHDLHKPDLNKHDRHRDDLREANEQLLIAALAAQEREAQAER